METDNIINLSSDELIDKYNKLEEFLTNLDAEIKTLEEGLNE